MNLRRENTNSKIYTIVLFLPNDENNPIHIRLIFTKAVPNLVGNTIKLLLMCLTLKFDNIKKYGGYLGWDLEGLVVAAIFLCLLGHQTNIRHVTSGLPVKLTVGNAVLNDALQGVVLK